MTGINFKFVRKCFISAAMLIVIYVSTFVMVQNADAGLTLCSHFNDTNSWNLNIDNGDYAAGDTNATVSGSAMWDTGFFSSSSPENKALYVTNAIPKINYIANDGNIQVSDPANGAITVGFWMKVTGDKKVRPLLIRSGDWSDYLMIDFGYNAVGRWTVGFQDSDVGGVQYSAFYFDASAYLTNWLYVVTVVDLGNNTISLFNYDDSGNKLYSYSRSINVTSWDITNGASSIVVNYQQSGVNNLWIDEFTIDDYAMVESNIQERVDKMVSGIELGMDMVPPEITLIGASPFILMVGDTYPELGATAFDNRDGDISSNIVIDASDINTSVTGTYYVTYNVSDAAGNAAVEVLRTVNIVTDTTPPVITLLGPATVTLAIGGTYTEYGASATDNFDGNISGWVITDSSSVNTSTAGTYYVTYNVSDVAGNPALEVVRTVHVTADSIPPVITLIGAAVVSLNVGDAYVEQGAMAADNVDGDISGSVIIDSSDVDTSTTGTYTVTYNVSDAAGNDAVEVLRSVVVTDLATLNFFEDFDTAADNYDPESTASLIYKYTASLATNEINFLHFGASTNTPSGSGKSFYIDASVTNIAVDEKWYYYLTLPAPPETLNYHGELTLSLDIRMDADTIGIARVSVDNLTYPLGSEVVDGIALSSSDADIWKTMKIDTLQSMLSLDNVEHFVGSAYKVRLEDLGRGLRHIILRISSTGPKEFKVYIDNYSLSGTYMDSADFDQMYIDNYSYPVWQEYLARVRADIDIREAMFATQDSMPILPVGPTDKQDYRFEKLTYYTNTITDNIAVMNVANAKTSGRDSYFDESVMAITDEYLARYSATIGPLTESINSPSADFNIYKVPAMKFGSLDEYTFPMQYEKLTGYNKRMARGEYASIAMLLDPAPGYSDTLTFTNSDFINGAVSFAATNLDVYIVKVWYQAGRDDSIRIDYLTGGKQFLTQELLLKNENLVRVTHDYAERYGEDSGTNELYVSDADGSNSRYINISTFYKSITDPTFPNPTNVLFSDSATLQSFNLDSKYKLLWGIVHVPTNVPAGTYTSTLQIKDSGNSVVKSVPLSIEVLPFDLEASRIDYSLYYHGKLRADKPESDIIPLSSYEKTTPQQRLELKDMKEHGVLYPAGYEDDLRVLDNTLALRNELGFPRDRFYSLGLPVRSYTTKETIMQWQSVLADYGYLTNGLYMYGMEEADSEALEALIHVTTSEVYAVGAKVFTALYKNAFDVVGDYMDVAVYAGGPLAHNIEEQVINWHSAGQEIFAYGCPQVGIENPEVYRRNFGILLYQKNFDGAMDYAYQKEYGIYWNDFDASLNEVAHREEAFTYPTTSGIVGTIEWEGYRVAITDMQYLSTLLKIRDALAAGGEDVTALDNWIDSLNVYGDLDVVRDQIVDKILFLSKNKSGFIISIR